MTQGSTRYRRFRYAIGAACVVSLASAPAATAVKPTPRPAKLVVTSLSSPPKSLAPGAGFTVRGKVKNTGGRAAPALIALDLRAKANPKTVYTLKGAHVKSVRPGRTVSFSVKVKPQAQEKPFAKGFLLQACVRTKRGSSVVSCRKASGRVVLAAKRPTTPAPPVAPVAPTPTTTTPVTPPTPVEYVSGARTLGDELYTTIGNGGYDVLHYDLDLDYKAPPAEPFLKGTATITAVTTENLKDFSLDFQGLNVASVTVNGELARHESDLDDNKLIITPATPVLADKEITVVVKYGGVPQIVVDPDGDLEGWITSKTWGAVALGEPVGSQGWFPVNNIPDDKATFDISVTTDDPFSAVSNGDLISTTAAGEGRKKYHWRESSLMTPYLATVSVSNFGTVTPNLLDPKRPLYLAVDQSLTNHQAIIDYATINVPKTLDFYAAYYDVPYPFSTAGAIVPRVDQGFGYILETQSKPTYPTTNPNAGQTTGSSTHENAHMWWGDLVTLKRWKDIWLNEGFATFSANLLTEQLNGGQTTKAKLDGQYSGSTLDGSRYATFWEVPTAAPPGAGDIFNNNAMYTRGSMVVASLREILGETTFKKLLHDWLVDNRDGNVTTPQFIAAVKQADPSTEPDRAARWDEFFRQWLYTSYVDVPAQTTAALRKRPTMTYANFASYPLPTP